MGNAGSAFDADDIDVTCDSRSTASPSALRAIFGSDGAEDHEEELRDECASSEQAMRPDNCCTTASLHLQIDPKPPAAKSTAAMAGGDHVCQWCGVDVPFGADECDECADSSESENDDTDESFVCNDSPSSGSDAGDTCERTRIRRGHAIEPDRD